MTERRFEGKTALISGGASGIGLATAKRLIADGATVWISDIQDELGESVAEEIGATYVRLDVVNESEWISVVELIASQGQGLHFVMNNAGIAVNGNLETETTEGFMRTININLLGVFLGCKVCAPLIEVSGGGAIVNVSSIYGMVSSSKVVAYSASKGGVRAMTKSIALDLARDKQGFELIPFTRDLRKRHLLKMPSPSSSPEEGEQFSARLAERALLGLADPDQIAAATVFLFSTTVPS
jgi:3alpha(or 20beta)-hydroxysteroid dehydrogenase